MKEKIKKVFNKCFSKINLEITFIIVTVFIVGLIIYLIILINDTRNSLADLKSRYQKIEEQINELLQTTCLTENEVARSEARAEECRKRGMAEGCILPKDIIGMINFVFDEGRARCIRGF